MLRCIMNAHYGGTANCGQDLFSNAVLGTETSRRRVVQYRSSVLLKTVSTSGLADLKLIACQHNTCQKTWQSICGPSVLYIKEVVC